MVHRFLQTRIVHRDEGVLVEGPAEDREDQARKGHDRAHIAHEVEVDVVLVPGPRRRLVGLADLFFVFFDVFVGG